VLSEHERHQLDDIELGLQSSDPALSAVFARLPGRPSRRRLLYARSMVALGILFVAAGVVVGFDPALMDGLVLVMAGSWWWAWLRAPAAAASSGSHRSPAHE
jgi:hypothetical protein